MGEGDVEDFHAGNDRTSLRPWRWILEVWEPKGFIGMLGRLVMTADAITVAKDDSGPSLKWMVPFSGLERRYGLEEAFGFEYIESRGLQSV